MKICLVITVSWPAPGGLQLLALRLAQHMKKEGHEARIIARFIEDRPLGEYFNRMDAPRLIWTEGVSVEIISVLGWRRALLYPAFGLLWRPWTFPLARALYLAAFGPTMKRALEDADLVHYLGSGTELLGYAAQAGARRKRIPFVVEPAVHIGQWGDSPRDWPLYRKADMVIAHSQFEAGALRDRHVPHVCTVRHGFDDLEPGHAAAFRRRHGIEGPMILFVGRRSKEKGYFRLLAAFAELRAHFPEATLVIAGAGEAPPCNAPGVLELGQVPAQIRQDALAACTVFCLPSEGESFGMAYFEAWAAEKPVVALDLPVLRETIGVSGGGLLADAKRPGDLVEKLRLLLEQAELARSMGLLGKKFALGYSWEAAIKGCLQAYAQIG